MHKDTFRSTNESYHIELQTSTDEGKQKINEIIRTFRENHMRLIQRIEESEKQRDLEQEISHKKIKEMYLKEKLDNDIWKGINLGSARSQLKTDRIKVRGIKQNSRKQNAKFGSMKKVTELQSEDCEEDLHFKMVKVKANKLIPLSIDKLKERLKLL